MGRLSRGTRPDQMAWRVRLALFRIHLIFAGEVVRRQILELLHTTLLWIWKYFVSENAADHMAIAKRHLVPKVCSDYFGRLDDGQEATAAETCGDGACSLHSLWGSVISSPFGNMYYCEDARRKLCEAMPIDVNDILSSPCGAATRALVDNLWSDVIGYVMRKTRQEAVVPGNCFFLGGGLGAWAAMRVVAMASVWGGWGRDGARHASSGGERTEPRASAAAAIARACHAASLNEAEDAWEGEGLSSA